MASINSKSVQMAPNGSKWVQIDPNVYKSKNFVSTFWVCHSLPWSSYSIIHLPVDTQQQMLKTIHFTPHTQWSNCSLHTVLWTLHNFYPTTYNAQKSVHTEHWTLYTVQCTLWKKHCTLYTLLKHTQTIKFTMHLLAVNWSQPWIGFRLAPFIG